MSANRFDPGYIRRPQNAWILYLTAKSRDAREEGRTPESSTQVSQRWAAEPPAVRQIYIDLAKEEARQHKIKYPDYKYKPQKKEKDSNSTGKKSAATRGAEMFIHDSSASPSISPIPTLPAGSSGESSSSQRVRVWPSSENTTPETELAGDDFEQVHPNIQTPSVSLTTESYAGPSSHSSSLVAQASGSRIVDTPRYSSNATSTMGEAPYAYYPHSQPRAVLNQIVDQPLTIDPRLLVAEHSGALDLQSDCVDTVPSLQQALELINFINADVLKDFDYSELENRDPESLERRALRLYARQQDNLNVLNYNGNNDSDSSLMGILTADSTLNFGPTDPFRYSSFAPASSRLDGERGTRAYSGFQIDRR